MAGPGPNPVFPSMRRDAILKKARNDGRVGVAELADLLSVTTETVRRDLVALERRGLLRRVHGGALLVSRSLSDVAFAERTEAMFAEKEAIAKAALKEVQEGTTVLLDAGTTTLALARLLPLESLLTVVTNDLRIAQLLTPNDRHTIVVIGGTVGHGTHTLTGPSAEAMLSRMMVDVAFMGTQGLSVQRGLTITDETEAAVKDAMIGAARRVVVLADRGKVGVDYFKRFADLEDIDLIITDAGLDAETREQFRAAGPEVVLA